MKPKIILAFLASFLLIALHASIANADEQVIIDTNTSSGVNAINIGEPLIAPDSIFWGIKNAFDKITIALTFDEQTKAEKGLKIAEERLLEFRKMADEGKIDAAEKAKLSYGDYIEKAKAAASGIIKKNKTDEIKAQIEIEKEAEEQENLMEDISASVKVKIETRGNPMTKEQKALINSLIASMQNQTGSVKIEIEKNKEKIKIGIKQSTGKSEDEIEQEIEEIENKTNLTAARTDKALERIQHAQKEIAKLAAGISANNITDNAVLVLLNNSREKLSLAENAFNMSKFGEAYGLANAAEHTAENALDKIERIAEKGNETTEHEREDKIERNITGNKTGEREHNRKAE